MFGALRQLKDGTCAGLTAFEEEELDRTVRDCACVRENRT